MKSQNFAWELRFNSINLFSQLFCLSTDTSSQRSKKKGGTNENYLLFSPLKKPIFYFCL